MGVFSFPLLFLLVSIICARHVWFMYLAITLSWEEPGMATSILCVHSRQRFRFMISLLLFLFLLDYFSNKIDLEHEYTILFRSMVWSALFIRLRRCIPSHVANALVPPVVSLQVVGVEVS